MYYYITCIVIYIVLRILYTLSPLKDEPKSIYFFIFQVYTKYVIFLTEPVHIPYVFVILHVGFYVICTIARSKAILAPNVLFDHHPSEFLQFLKKELPMQHYHFVIVWMPKSLKLEKFCLCLIQEILSTVVFFYYLFSWQ